MLPADVGSFFLVTFASSIPFIVAVPLPLALAMGGDRSRGLFIPFFFGASSVFFSFSFS
jgi:hypothetical protein